MQFSLTEHQEVNVKGVYLNVHHFLKQAPDGNGTVITLSTGTLGDIYPDFGSYIPSKLAQTKFMEFLHEGKLLLRRNSHYCALTNTF
jgi:NADP-dependent 3-hydroxy acid dehydrogenase YdfG